MFLKNWINRTRHDWLNPPLNKGSGDRGSWGLVNEINSFALERSFSVHKTYLVNVDMVHKDGSSGKDINF